MTMNTLSILENIKKKINKLEEPRKPKVEQEEAVQNEAVLGDDDFEYFDDAGTKDSENIHDFDLSENDDHDVLLEQEIEGSFPEDETRSNDIDELDFDDDFDDGLDDFGGDNKNQEQDESPNEEIKKEVFEEEFENFNEENEVQKTEEDSGSFLEDDNLFDGIEEESESAEPSVDEGLDDINLDELEEASAEENNDEHVEEKLPEENHDAVEGHFENDENEDLAVENVQNDEVEQEESVKIDDDDFFKDDEILDEDESQEKEDLAEENHEINQEENKEIAKENQDLNEKLFENGEKYQEQKEVIEQINGENGKVDISQSLSDKVSDSIQDLVETKKMVKEVDNLAKSELLPTVACELMKPKIDDWLEQNLPSLVQDIVRQEIKKIISKS